jgi:diacylglycerol kinase (ATP)
VFLCFSFAPLASFAVKVFLTSAMKKAVLIFNPSSGRNRERRAEKIARCAEIFRAAGVQAELCATTGSGSAIGQAREAANAGADTIIACGGDGTMNECLNGIMQAASPAVLGVIPLGSGNLLATDIGLPLGTEKAAHALLACTTIALKPGRIRCFENGAETERYFVVAAGVGADADLMYRTDAEAKKNLGMYAYFAEMARMLVRPRLPMFQVEWRGPNESLQTAEVSLVMALRTRRFPRLMRFVNVGSALERNDYRLLLFRTNKVRHFVNYFTSVITGCNWKVSAVELACTTWFRCTPLESRDPGEIHTEVDGELLGTLPVEVSIAERTFQLLIPG